MATVIKPPASLDANGRYTVFLPSSIGLEINRFVESELSDLDIAIYSSWPDDDQAAWEPRHDDTFFRQQVIWELNAGRQADLIILCFPPGVKTPISLMELGLFAEEDKLCVLSPVGYWRKGNVDIVCQMYGIPLFDSWDSLLHHVRVMATLTKSKVKDAL